MGWPRGDQPYLVNILIIKKYGKEEEGWPRCLKFVVFFVNYGHISLGTQNTFSWVSGIKNNPCVIICHPPREEIQRESLHERCLDEKTINTPLAKGFFGRFFRKVSSLTESKFITLAKVDFPLGQAADISDKRRLTNANRQKKKIAKSISYYYHLPLVSYFFLPLTSW